MARRLGLLLGVALAAIFISLPIMAVRAEDTSTAEVTFRQASSVSKPAKGSSSTAVGGDQVKTGQSHNRQGVQRASTSSGRHYSEPATVQAANQPWWDRLPQTDEQTCQWLLTIMGGWLLILVVIAGYYHAKYKRYQQRSLHQN
ncbi:hypothetical protein N692_03595 [Lactiplantibacillus plantarum EGD-AQ4]|nr:hypothetical protein N692_03595 [Lactiplantibacillus plantarum EGD-AQ4]